MLPDTGSHVESRAVFVQGPHDTDPVTEVPVKVLLEHTLQLELPAFVVKVPAAQAVHAFVEVLTSPPGAELPAAHCVP